MLDWKQVAAMAASMEFGSHTCNHYNLAKLDAPQRDYEINHSKAILEQRLGQPVLAFSYPGGNASDGVKTAVMQSQYDFAVTTTRGVNHLREPYALKRINIWEGTTASRKGKFCKSLFAYHLLGW